MNNKKLCIFGLDCATPEFVFDKFKAELPTFNRLMQQGSWGRLVSTTPPITVPAWSAMTTGKDPGELGLYGFRNRIGTGYELASSNNSAVKTERIWDRLNRLHGTRSIIIGIPQTFPPRIENGIMISGIMTPSNELDYSWPHSYKSTVERISNDYVFDVKNFRKRDTNELRTEINHMTRTRFKLIRHMLETEQWDFMMMVEIGLDRMQHIFWGNESVLLDYYKLLDTEIAKTIEILPDDTRIMVVSDHGAQSMNGGFCINDWLTKHGYLTLKTSPTSVTPFSESLVDWEHTQAWGAGGYYGRIFLNVQGREPQGAICENQYQSIRDQIRQKIRDQSSGLKNNVFYPEQIYKQVNGTAPDMLVYFDELNFRSIGSIGHDAVLVAENDDGNDLANHSQHGIFIDYNPAWLNDHNQSLGDVQITDIFTLVLNAFSN
ncbi:alkaline phosphatase family protein [candidate division KSB1 bacterium]|nr:alkaline phosphatase family protein [candidate division KSB1 bacterium]